MGRKTIGLQKGEYLLTVRLRTKTIKQLIYFLATVVACNENLLTQITQSKKTIP
jgi:hypothetical protein